MPNATCQLDECANPVKRAGYCYGHYMKNWRYGTPTPMHPTRCDMSIVGKRFGCLVVTDERDGRYWVCRCDCGALTNGDAGNLNRGSKTSCGDHQIHHRRDDIKYGAAHQRVRTDRGLVQGHACVGCGRQAQHWSYDHNDPDELFDHNLSANPVAYSPDPWCYSPRCVSCHKLYDLGRAHATPERVAG